MTEETKILEQIDRYLEGSMGEAESAFFEIQLASDVDLASLLEASQLTEEVVVGYEVLKLKEQMAKDLAKPTSNVRNYLIGAVLLACVGMGAYFSQSDKKKIGTIHSDEKVDFVGKTVATSSEQKPSKVEGKHALIIPLSKTKSVEGEPTYFTVGQVRNSKEDLKCQESKKEVENKDVQQKLAHNLTTEPLKEDHSPSYFSSKKEEEKMTDSKNINETVNDVQEKTINSSKEFSYNPAYDPAWNIPYDTNKKPKSIKILDKSGREVFQSNVLDFSPAEWNGESNTGLAIGVGYHLYFIEYADGTVDKGSLTILR
jgi:hypothetical protein